MIPNNIQQMVSKMFPNIGNIQNINTPDDMAQHLLNSGVVTQSQVNQARKMWGNPQIQQMIQTKYRF